MAFLERLGNFTQNTPQGGFQPEGTGKNLEKSRTHRKIQPHQQETPQGPGAVFWMWISALLGMMTGCIEKILAVRYRERGENGWQGTSQHHRPGEQRQHHPHRQPVPAQGGLQRGWATPFRRQCAMAWPEACSPMRRAWGPRPLPTPPPTSGSPASRECGRPPARRRWSWPAPDFLPPGRPQTAGRKPHPHGHGVFRTVGQFYLESLAAGVFPAGGAVFFGAYGIFPDFLVAAHGLQSFLQTAGVVALEGLHPLRHASALPVPRQGQGGAVWPTRPPGRCTGRCLRSAFWQKAFLRTFSPFV